MMNERGKLQSRHATIDFLSIFKYWTMVILTTRSRRYRRKHIQNIEISDEAASSSNIKYVKMYSQKIQIHFFKYDFYLD